MSRVDELARVSARIDAASTAVDATGYVEGPAYRAAMVELHAALDEYERIQGRPLPS